MQAWWIQAALGGVDVAKAPLLNQGALQDRQRRQHGGESGFSVGENISGDTPHQLTAEKMAGRYEGGLRYEPAITGAQAAETSHRHA